MGPKKFEATFKKRMQGLFNETKVFFFHCGDKTKIGYIAGKKLKYVNIYREEYELDYWSNHFLDYLKTGTFDDNAYWQVYNSDTVNMVDADWLSEITPVKMKCVEQVWSVHSSALNKFMKETRN